MMQTQQDWRVQRPFFSVGFNYHPSASGCQYWQQWNAEQLHQDCAEMARRGFNTVRFFLFWADFEPAPGEYAAASLAHLREFVSIAQQYDLWCIPALLTIWMNGQLFDLPWRAGRDLWTDREMVVREQNYVQRIAMVLRDAPNLLAYDLGDEVIHIDLPRAQMLSRAAVRAWQQKLAEAIRQVDASALVLQGNEASAVLGQHEFRAENSQALDIIAIHGFPLWSPFAIEAVASYKASSFVPFLVQFSRMNGPVLLDELGCYGTDEIITRDFLRATTHSALANGAQGTIVWCWQDFTARAKPFDKHPNERFVGLLRADGQAKPAMRTLEQFAARTRHEWSNLTLPPAPIGVYVPERAEQTTTYIQQHTASHVGLFYAYLLLKRAHLPFEFTRTPLHRYKLIICPSIEHITLHELEQLAHYVEQGGTLYYSSADYLHGFGGEALFGVQLKDFTLATEALSSFRWRDQQYTIDWPQRGTRYPQASIIQATNAKVLAAYPDGSPAFTRHNHGKGHAYYLNAPLEQHLDVPFRLYQQPWQTLYSHLAALAGVRRVADVDHPDVELGLLCDDQRQYAFLINHATSPISCTFTRYDQRQTCSFEEKIMLQGKDVHVLNWQAPSADLLVRPHTVNAQPFQEIKL